MSEVAMLPPAIHELAGTRREVYDLLARLLRGPAAAADRVRLRDTTVLERLGALYGESAVRAWNHAAAEPAPALSRREERDFMDLLATPSTRFVKPWESVWRDERRVGEKLVKGLMCGPSALAVAQAYAVAGARFEPAGLADLPDNACVEVAFLAHLCEVERGAAAEGRTADADRAVEDQRRFVADHLARWLPALGDAIAERAVTDLYRGLGSFLRAFVLAEERLLAQERPPAG